MSYFKTIPQIVYGEKIARNLTVRAKFLNGVLSKANSFYPYTIKEGERPDHVAYNYYDDSNLVWLVFMANDIVDPYYDWPLDYFQFVELMKDKYGSLSASQSLILKYRHKTKDIEITPDTFNIGDTIVAGDYDPVYAYDYENEVNEAKRNIRLLDKRLSRQAQNDLKRLMNG